MKNSRLNAIIAVVVIAAITACSVMLFTGCKSNKFSKTGNTTATEDATTQDTSSTSALDTLPDEGESIPLEIITGKDKDATAATGGSDSTEPTKVVTDSNGKKYVMKKNAKGEWEFEIDMSELIK